MADDKKKSDRDRLDALILLLLGALVAGAEDWLEKPTGDLAGALIPIIADYHAKAGVLGRQAAGDTAKPDATDEQFGKVQAQSDAPYLAKFQKQLAAGWGKDEAGALDGKALRARLQLYAERLHASAHEAFVLASPADSRFIWHLGDVAFEHCPDCPVIADGSPYTADTMPTYPGAGDTECLTLCKCWLERQDGLAPFAGD